MNSESEMRKRACGFQTLHVAKKNLVNHELYRICSILISEIARRDRHSSILLSEEENGPENSVEDVRGVSEGGLNL